MRGSRVDQEESNGQKRETTDIDEQAPFEE